jgi:hypothetical protein
VIRNWAGLPSACISLPGVVKSGNSEVLVGMYLAGSAGPLM